MKLIVGLGNPGPKYHLTRHNLGYRVLDLLGERLKVTFAASKFHGDAAVVLHPIHHKVHLLKPLTFMNKSGEAAGPYAHFYKISPQDVLAVHDDLDLPLGRLRFATGGGAAGHNGVSSLIEHLGGKDFHRLKLGIGRPVTAAQSVVDYVLEGFSKVDESLVGHMVDTAAEALEVYLSDGLTRAMERFNGVTFPSMV